jgi:hypothetical protein
LTSWVIPPEVQHLDGSVRAELDVPWLQVAVNDALLVGGRERSGDLSETGQDFREGHGPFRQAFLEGLALQQLHHDGRLALELFDPKYGGDMGAVQRSQQLGFPLEPVQALLPRGNALGQNLDGHLPA